MTTRVLLFGPRQMSEQSNETPREREFRRQINDLQLKLARQRANFEAEVAKMREARAASAAQQAIQTPKKSGAEWRAEVHALQEALAAMQSRVDAGMYRRTRMLHVLGVFVKCEDDPTMTDERYEELMTEALKQARALVSLERRAREEERARNPETLSEVGG